MTIFEIMYMLIVHYIADFVLQTDEEALNKSTSNKALLSHTLTYSGVWMVFNLCCYSFINPAPLAFLLLNFVFPIITFIIHTITDYFTSRWSSKLYKQNNRHGFFLVIGFDQILHYLQLIITFVTLKSFLQ